MHIEHITLNSSNKFLTDYFAQSKELMQHYDYRPFDHNVFMQRVNDLKERTFDRENLADVLEKLNNRWEASEQTFENIDRIRRPDSVVVIGGQQAGLLGGPLYTVHKIISILQLAQEQEAKLNIPVIPVFWIAGEDHDYDEVNHIYLPVENELQKLIWNDKSHEKASVSNREINQVQGLNWLNTVFSKLEETAFSKSLYNKIKDLLTQSNTMVDFFGRFMHELFRETGIVFVDSGDRLVRQLEKQHFQALIEKQSTYSKEVFQSLQSMRIKGYNVSVEVEEDDGHLFYHYDNQRILLKRDGQEWIGKNNECRLSHEALLEIANNQPELLSNNVVTRPVMQEMLFPTLAFFGGPSEVAYWSILKPVFRAIEIKMPPVLPRFSITIVEKKIKKAMEQYAIKTDEAISGGVMTSKQNWLNSQLTPPVELLTDQVKQMITSAHKPLVDQAKGIKTDIGEYAEKNLQYILDHVEQLSNRMNKELQLKFQKELADFDKVLVHLRPEEGLQERLWNVIYFLNKYGPDFLRNNLIQNYEDIQKHQAVYL
ncbi:bacillithiol biosynthesis cysteine-adding enzyme BshC [Gracilibacillus ureilyticus]|uniref:Putative cysteine ligase BshC n=1 Tax=Gracilibacillus ureilyticus TaxID=531814 RepID=A0A1H9TIK8_9BACI|nr:bacillithiol biosynthesis cysteine-adding enzyme BshC [Gracilibacillus ureilyticus]SER96689.1 bacillithiol biosynthesis cysteine-adding enzyme BshC [Gracilibacillus ureilyticus]